MNTFTRLSAFTLLLSLSINSFGILNNFIRVSSAFRAGLGARIRPCRTSLTLFESNRSLQPFLKLNTHSTPISPARPKKAEISRFSGLYAWLGCIGLGFVGWNLPVIRSKVAHYFNQYNAQKEAQRVESAKKSKMWHDVAIISKVL